MGSHVGKLVDHRGQWNTPHTASVPVVRAARCNLHVARPWMQSVHVSTGTCVKGSPRLFLQTVPKMGPGNDFRSLLPLWSPRESTQQREANL